jgi:hypothetical protein
MIYDSLESSTSGVLTAAGCLLAKLLRSLKNSGSMPTRDLELLCQAMTAALVATFLTTHIHESLSQTFCCAAQRPKMAAHDLPNAIRVVLACAPGMHMASLFTDFSKAMHRFTHQWDVARRESGTGRHMSLHMDLSAMHAALFSISNLQAVLSRIAAPPKHPLSAHGIHPATSAQDADTRAPIAPPLPKSAKRATRTSTALTVHEKGVTKAARLATDPPDVGATAGIIKSTEARLPACSRQDNDGHLTMHVQETSSGGADSDCDLSCLSDGVIFSESGMIC